MISTLLAMSAENSTESCYDIRDAWRVRFVGSNRLQRRAMITWPELPDCGVYLFWPESGTEWIHPDDVGLVEDWIPSTRVFRRHSFDGIYYRLQYGVDVLRVKPTLWNKVDDEGFWVGDQVEVRTVLFDREPCIATISEMRLDRVSGQIQYQLIHREMPLPNVYSAADLMRITMRPQISERAEAILVPQPTADLGEQEYEIADSDPTIVSNGDLGKDGNSHNNPRD